MSALSSVNPFALSPTLRTSIFGNLVLRVASNATGVMLALYLKFISQNLEPISAFTVGLFSITFYVSELALAPVFGAMSDRYGRKLFMIIGSVSGLIAVIMTGLTALIPILLVTRLLEGLSTASSAPAILGEISAETAEDEGVRGRAVALFEVATVVGIAGGAALGGVLFDRFHTTGFFIVAVIYAISWFIFSRIKSVKSSVATHSASLARHIEILANPRVLRFAPAWLAINAIVGVWFAHGAFQLAGSGNAGDDQFLAGGFTGGTVGTIFGVFGLTFLVGCYLWGLLFTRISRSSMMMMSLGGVYGAVVLLYLINRYGDGGGIVLTILTILLLVAVLVESGFTPAALGFLADIAEEYPEDRGTIMGFYSIFLGGGQLIGSALGAPFAEAYAINGLILLTLILTTVAFVTVLLLRTRKAPPVPSPAKTGSAAS